MILQHPVTQKKKRVPAVSMEAIKLIEEGWKDVTPPRTAKQIAISRAWQSSGTVARVAINIYNIVESPYITLTPEDREILKQAMQILNRTTVSFQVGGLTSPSPSGILQAHWNNSVRKT